MLKEMVALIGEASAAHSLAENDHGNDIDSQRLRNAILQANVGIAKHDEEKRQMSEAICLLFRAVHEAGNDTDNAFALVGRAERLLGFVELEPAKQ